LGGKKSNLLSSSKQTSAYSVARHYWNFKWDWFLWSDETKIRAFRQQKLKVGFKYWEKSIPVHD